MMIKETNPEKCFVNKDNKNYFGIILNKSSNDENVVLFCTFDSKEMRGGFERANINEDWWDNWKEISLEEFSDEAEAFGMAVEKEFSGDLENIGL